MRVNCKSTVLTVHASLYGVVVLQVNGAVSR